MSTSRTAALAIVAVLLGGCDGFEWLTEPGTCDGIDCSGHGQCREVPDIGPMCECEPGYAVRDRVTCVRSGDADTDVDTDTDTDTDVDPCAPRQTVCTEDGWCLNSIWPAPSELVGIWGSSKDSAWAIAQDGLILRWDGAGWYPFAWFEQTILNDVWGADAGHVWVVGANGQVLFFDGESWQRQATPEQWGLNGVWGAALDDVWAVGSFGRILHYDGTSWSLHSEGFSDRDFRAVWGSSADRVWAVGESSAIWTYDGKTWSRVEHDFDPYMYEFTDVWGADALNAWIVGQNGIALSLASGEWTRIAGAWEDRNLDVVFGLDASQVWLAAHSIYNLATNENETEDVLPTIEPRILGLWGHDADRLWAVGQERLSQAGAILERSAGTWSFWNEAALWSDLVDVWAAKPCEVFVAGSTTGIRRWDGERWNEESISGSGALTGLHGTDADHLWATSATGKILRRSGGSWQQEHDAGDVTLNSIWAYDANRVWAVGENGLVLSRDASGAWTGQQIADSQELAAVWGTAADDVWVAARWGSVYHFDGQTWQEHWKGQFWYIEDLWVSKTGTIWLVGAEDDPNQAGRSPDPVLFQSRGGAWLANPPPVRRPLRAVWGTDDDNVFVVTTDDEALFRWDGTAWHAEDYPGNGDRIPVMPLTGFNAVSGTASGHVWVVGANGQVMYKRGEGDADVDTDIDLEIVWEQTSNPSVMSDYAEAMVAHPEHGLYVIGDSATGGYEDTQWRIEKRRLGDGSLLDSVEEDVTPRYDTPYAAAIDDSGIYVVGHSGAGEYSAGWRIEKRSLDDLSLLWVQQHEPPLTGGIPYGTAVNGTGVYVAGGQTYTTGVRDWRIEKRDLQDGSLLWTRTEDMQGGSGRVFDAVASGEAVFVTGDVNCNATRNCWRTDRLDPADGSSLWTAGGTIDSTLGQPAAIAADEAGVYVVGSERQDTERVTHVEKLDPDTGAAIWKKSGFDGFGFSWTKAAVLADDLIVVGNDDDSIPDDRQWRIERWSKHDGTLLWGQNYDFSRIDDRALCAAISGSMLFVGGMDGTQRSAENGADDQWRMIGFNLLP